MVELSRSGIFEATDSYLANCVTAKSACANEVVG